jgi:exodeoxyribonuclease VIII
MESEFFKSVKTNIKDLSNEDYHGNKDYVSASGLKLIKKSPLHYKEHVTVETEALLFGSAYHTYILEPEIFDSEFFVFNPLKRPDPSKNFNATVNKQWKNDIYLQHKNVITVEQYEQIKSMKDRLFKNIYARNLLKKGIAEQSFMFDAVTFENKEIGVKVRPDYIKEKKRIVVDLKTCSDASEQGFQKQAAQYDYHIQAALYVDMMEQFKGDRMPWSFIFIAQEKSYPYAYGIYEASPQFIAQGRYEYEQLIMLYQQCKETDNYPGYQVFVENKFGIKELSLPPWAIREINFYKH